MPRGRPKQSPYDPEVADEICERIASSDDGLEQVLEHLKGEIHPDRIPSIRVVYRWLEGSEEFRQKSARAREFQSQILHDRAQVQAKTPIVGIVRTVRHNAKGEEDIEERTHDNVERSKLLVQTTLRRAGQLNPKKYGEKLQADVNFGGESSLADAISAARKRLRSANVPTLEEWQQDTL